MFCPPGPLRPKTKRSVFRHVFAETSYLPKLLELLKVLLCIALGSGGLLIFASLQAAPTSKPFLSVRRAELPRLTAAAHPPGTSRVTLAVGAVHAPRVDREKRNRDCLLNGTAVRARQWERSRLKVPSISPFTPDVNAIVHAKLLHVMDVGEGEGGLGNVAQPRLEPRKRLRASLQPLWALKGP